MGKELDLLKGHLRKGDQRLTSQRRQILEEAFSTHDHFSVEDLEDRFRRRGKKVSKATIYRTLSLLKELHLIEEHDFGRNTKYYEHIYGHPHHDHMVCLKCGRIEEFRSDKIEHLQNTVAKKVSFKIVHHSHKLFGYCHDCDE
jgi:Fur family transcriptional regulator, ferric uptake regulator